MGAAAAPVMGGAGGLGVRAATGTAAAAAALPALHPRPGVLQSPNFQAHDVQLRTTDCGRSYID